MEELKRCNYCGGDVFEDAKKCKYCGSRLKSFDNNIAMAAVAIGAFLLFVFFMILGSH